jgi:putative ABC transport system permease protein
LVVAEVTLAIVLLVGTGLLLRSLAMIHRVDPGLAVDGVVFARAYPSEAGYPTGGRVNAFYQTVVERLRRLPGVQSAAVSSIVVVDDQWTAGYVIEDEWHGGEPNLRMARNAIVSDEYFGTLGIPLLRGRRFDERDRDGAPLVVMVNETMARMHWHGADPVGRRLAWGVPTPDRWRTIVGVVADAKEGGLEAETKPAMYVPVQQANRDTTTMPLRSMVIAVRAARDPEQLVGPLRTTVAAVDPTVAVDGVRTVRQIYAGELAPRRFITLLITIFGMAALGLAALGLYGVLSHQIAERIPEIGVRLALGARPRDVVKSVVGEGLGFTGLGLGLGGVLALPLTGLLGKLLFGVGRFDPLTFAGVSIVLGLAALAATYLPARRAARVDPMTALRSE